MVMLESTLEDLRRHQEDRYPPSRQSSSLQEPPPDSTTFQTFRSASTSTASAASSASPCSTKNFRGNPYASEKAVDRIGKSRAGAAKYASSGGIQIPPPPKQLKGLLKETLFITIPITELHPKVGFSVHGGRDEYGPVIVNNVIQGTPAEFAGLTIGDQIQEVNGEAVHSATHNELVSLIQKGIQGRELQLKVKRSPTRKISDTTQANTNGNVGRFSKANVSSAQHHPYEPKFASNPVSRQNSHQKNGVTDAFLVSVDPNHKRVLENRLQKTYPGVRTVDMTEVPVANKAPLESYYFKTYDENEIATYSQLSQAQFSSDLGQNQGNINRCSPVSSVASELSAFAPGEQTGQYSHRGSHESTDGFVKNKMTHISMTNGPTEVNISQVHGSETHSARQNFSNHNHYGSNKVKNNFTNNNCNAPGYNTNGSEYAEVNKMKGHHGPGVEVIDGPPGELATASASVLVTNKVDHGSVVVDSTSFASKTQVISPSQPEMAAKMVNNNVTTPQHATSIGTGPKPWYTCESNITETSFITNDPNPKNKVDLSTFARSKDPVILTKGLSSPKTFRSPRDRDAPDPGQKESAVISVTNSGVPFVYSSTPAMSENAVGKAVTSNGSVKFNRAEPPHEPQQQFLSTASLMQQLPSTSTATTSYLPHQQGRQPKKNPENPAPSNIFVVNSVKSSGQNLPQNNDVQATLKYGSDASSINYANEADKIDDRLKRYTEDLRKRRESNEKLASQEQFLRSSLRQSQKLKLLEQQRRRQQNGRPQNGVAVHDVTLTEVGVVNQAYSHPFTEATNDERLVSSKTPAGIEEVITSVNRVSQALEEFPQHREDAQYLRELFSNSDMHQAIGLTNAIQDHWNRTATVRPAGNNVLSETETVLSLISGLVSYEAQQLRHLLQQPNMRSLLYSHDGIAQKLQESCPHLSGEVWGLKETPLDELQNTENIRIIRLFKERDYVPLGATVKMENGAIVIGRIVKGGVIEKSGLFREGDEILEVNGTDVRGKSIAEVCELLTDLSGPLTFVICLRNLEGEAEASTSTEKPRCVKYMRALFDYDADADIYLPCRELGLSFDTGDILHVISMEDARWWQAYREGEDNPLAGLIPSAEFQEQREKYNRDMMVESATNSSNNGFLCHRTKKGKKFKSNDLSGVLDAELGEIRSYEEVALYMPRSGRRRPIVLVAPPNVGCLELRQRLMESNRDRFAGVVPHTSRPKRANEQDGIHYWFVAKAAFQADVHEHKFVEWGEYQKHYYGTSISAIKNVVSRGQTCVLTLRAQSLPALRDSGLMPYVVYITTPPQRLKINQQKNGLKDEDIKAIYDEDYATFEKYGHLVDHQIVNIDPQRSLQELLGLIHRLETEPQFVPIQWLQHANGTSKLTGDDKSILPSLISS